MNAIVPSWCRIRRAFRGWLLPFFLFTTLSRPPAVSAAEMTLTEYQVKALFLLNFTKYVEWPEVAFSTTNAPVTIGLYGGGRFLEIVKKAAASKTVNGRPILVEAIEKGMAPEKCQMLFISDSEKKLTGQILEKLKGLPVLTVGENDQFLSQGGVVNFVKKDANIRLEINLDAARQSKLKISSKLLNVADSVTGRAR
jgi:hypothetical protein